MLTVCQLLPVHVVSYIALLQALGLSLFNARACLNSLVLQALSLMHSSPASQGSQLACFARCFIAAAGAEFDEFMGEVMESLQAWQSHMLVQFEDFGNNNAFRLLDSWRHKMCAFNDDIQVRSSSAELMGR
jgi:malic enzyme